MKVKDLMTPEPVSCRPEDSDRDAARQMWESDCGVLPVVDPGGVVVGLVTDRDICMNAYTRGLPLGDMKVSEAMSTQVESCRPDDELEQAVGRMGVHRVRRLPVVDDRGRLQGVLSMNDVFRHVAGLKEGKGRQSLMKVVVESMARICEPWPSVAARA